jgi:hypothetical protein
MAWVYLPTTATLEISNAALPLLVSVNVLGALTVPTL